MRQHVDAITTNLSREVAQAIKNKLQFNKVVLLFGARRVGKTMLIKQLLQEIDVPPLLLNGDDITIHNALAEISIENYKRLLGSYTNLNC